MALTRCAPFRQVRMLLSARVHKQQGNLPPRQPLPSAPPADSKSWKDLELLPFSTSDFRHAPNVRFVVPCLCVNASGASSTCWAFLGHGQCHQLGAKMSHACCVLSLLTSICCGTHGGDCQRTVFLLDGRDGRVCRHCPRGSACIHPHTLPTS